MSIKTEYDTNIEENWMDKSVSGISLRAKFIIPMVVLIAILLFFGTTLFYIHYERQQQLKILSIHIQHSQYISELIHELQKERGLSTGVLLNSNDETFKQKLKQQRKQTRHAISRLLEIEKHYPSFFFNEKTELGKSVLLRIKEIRRAVDLKKFTYNDAISAYSTLTTDLLKHISRTIDYSNVPRLTRELLAYTNLLYMKEFRGIERAKGVQFFMQGNFSSEEILDFHSFVIKQNEHEHVFLTYVDRPLRIIYEKNVRQNAIEEKIHRIREIILTNGKSQTETITAWEWYTLLTKSLNHIQHVSELLKDRILHRIDHLMHTHESRFVIVTAISVLSFFIFVLMIVAFFRLYNEEQKLRNVFEKYIISSITDLKGRILNVSQAFCDISGYSKDELIGKPHSIVRHPDMPKEVFKELWDKLKKGESWSGKIKNRKKDGSFYWVYAHIEPLYDNKGNIEAYIAVRLDITESELLHEKVIQKEKENKAAYEMMLHQSRLAQMGELLSMIAHQWRQPLNSIGITVATLKLKAQRGKCDPQNVVQVSERIETLIRHLNQTIDDFRNFFKPEKEKKITSFTKIVRSVEGIIGKTLETKGIVFTVDIQNDAEFICYENELIQVILNIVKNAEDALAEKEVSPAEITLRVHDFIIEIEDNAGGIPEEVLPKIYDPYFSTKMQKDGTGLGLYMSKMIVEDHCGGKLSVENTSKGACFFIDLTHLQQTDVCNLLPSLDTQA